MNIGVFDSGFGGLTVFRALLDRLPAASYIYLGDTARLPYGAKSQSTVARYAVSSANFLVDQGAEYLVIACNTASALALDAIRESVPVPVLGVIETGANAAKASTKTGDVLVIATAATVESHAYSAACRERGLRAHEMACPLLVPLVEEGWIDHPGDRRSPENLSCRPNGRITASRPEPGHVSPRLHALPASTRQHRAQTASNIKVIDSAEATAGQVASALTHNADHLAVRPRNAASTPPIL